MLSVNTRSMFSPELQAQGQAIRARRIASNPTLSASPYSAAKQHFSAADPST
jgi:hypothetical protein